MYGSLLYTEIKPAITKVSPTVIVCSKFCAFFWAFSQSLRIHPTEECEIGPCPGWGLRQIAYPIELYLIYLEIVLSIKRRNQKHGGFDVTISLLSWDNPLTTAQVWPGAFVHSLLIFFNELQEIVLLMFYCSYFSAFLESVRDEIHVLATRCSTGRILRY